MRSFAGVIGLVVVLGVVQAALASSFDDEIAARIKKVGNVCVEGQSCASATPASTVVATAESAGGGEATFKKTCAICHATGVAGAPKLGSSADWAPRIKQGMDVLYKHAIDGKPPGMPPKGTCSTTGINPASTTEEF